MSRFRRVLYATDFSPASSAAFRTALALAKADRAELLVTHVQSSVIPLMGEGYVSPKAFEEIEASARAHGQRQLDALLKKARRAGVRARGMLLDGVPHERIVRAARAKRADLIVIGTHGRTGLARFVLGSVAARVVGAARCPVLTVRGR